MSIRYVQESDRKSVLEFCKNTFSWGDYIPWVWYNWLKEGQFITWISNNVPVALCHSVFIRPHSMWIEGIRVHPHFRRKNVATKLIQWSESHAKQIGILYSSMLIEKENTPSITMAKKNGYEIETNWSYYSLDLKDTCTNLNNLRSINQMEFLHGKYFVDSWRWEVLDHKSMISLIKNKQIISQKNNVGFSFAILKPSRHFSKTLICTIYGNSDTTIDLLQFLRRYGYENRLRMQVLSNADLSGIKGVNKNTEFFLLKKTL